MLRHFDENVAVFEGKHQGAWLTSWRDCAKSLKVINILDRLFRHVGKKQYLYMIFEESEKIV